MRCVLDTDEGRFGGHMRPGLIGARSVTEHSHKRSQECQAAISDGKLCFGWIFSIAVSSLW